jgi:predicted dehydrogenase
MKCAIIGCGNIAKSHLRSIRKAVPTAEIHLVDVERARAEAMASAFNVPSVFDNVDAMLSAVRPDAVHIVTPARTHVELAEKTLAAGCHTYVEKPVAESVEDYMRLYQSAQTHQRVLCCGYSVFGMPVVMRAMREITSGSLGRLIAVHCDFAGSEGVNVIPYKDPLHWAYRLRGGVLQNMIDHPASLVTSVLDTIVGEDAYFTRRNILPHNHPDLVHVSLHGGDQIGSFTLSLGHGVHERRATFLLEGGTIRIDLARQLYSCVRGKGSQNFVKKATSGIQEGYAYAGGTVKNVLDAITGKLQRDPGIFNVVSNFYHAIHGSEELLVSHTTVVKTTRLLQNVWEHLDAHPAQERMVEAS